ncbi:MAG: hemolysin III family protein [Sulfurospirillaceae bacterium]|nr:hemolysin III family protein [Sulfurospirillaceae bacterium]
MEKLVGRYSLAEEILNASTHGLGILLSIVGLSVLVAFSTLNGSVILIVSCAIFGASLIFGYTFSTLYHAITNEKAKQIFRKFDHASIYFLIAGTYTPIALVVLKGILGWSIFGVVWAVSIFGIILEFIDSAKFRKLSILLYLLMGWFIVIATNQLIHNMAPGGLWLIVIGGLSYSIGVVFYLWKKIPYNHAIWHLFVLGGSICHYFAVLFFIV